MLLRLAGYYTGFIGKYGVEYAPADGKRDIEGPEVFDRWYGFYGQGVYFPKEHPGKHLNEVMVDLARDPAVRAELQPLRARCDRLRTQAGSLDDRRTPGLR
jgi:hypothetical protein